MCGVPDSVAGEPTSQGVPGGRVRRLFLSDPEKGDDGASLRRQTALAKFGELALRSDDLDEILTEACRLVGDALGTDLAKVMELQADGASLSVRAGVGWTPGVVGEVTLEVADNSSEGHALKTGEPTISPDIATETRFTYPPFLIANGVKAVADVVIIGGQDRPPFGILQVDSRTPRRFTDADTAFLRGYANLLAAAVDRLRVIADMRHEEARLRLALDAAEMGTWDLDLLDGSARRSPWHDRIFGYPEPTSEWNLATFLDHVLAKDRPTAETAFLDAMTTGDLAFECRIARADGALRWIAVKGRADFAERPATMDRIPVRMVSVVRDVTANRQAQLLLRQHYEGIEAQAGERTRALADANRQVTREAEGREQSEARFAAAFRLAPVPMMVSRLDGFRILDVNEAFVDTLGHAAADAIGRTADELKLWGASAARQRFQERLQASGRVRNQDVRLMTKTGWFLDCLASAEVVTIAGERCALSVLQDITERKRSEAELFEAIEAVMQDTSWFSRTIIEKLAHLRHPERTEASRTELADLTPRERDVLGLLCQGMNGDGIAKALGLARNTVRNHLATLYAKIGAHGRSDAIIWARERGFTGLAGRPSRP